MHPFMAL